MLDAVPTADKEQRQALLANWRQLADKVDAFFSAIQARRPEAMACQAGCTACCQQDLSVLLVEALAIDATLQELPEGQRNEIAERGAVEAPPCAFLGAGGRCAVYASRPLVCRTHGLPIRERSLEDQPDENEGQRISVCQLNFTDGVVEPDAVLDGTTLVATLTVVDNLARQQLGVDQPMRVPLRQLAKAGL